MTFTTLINVVMVMIVLTGIVMTTTVACIIENRMVSFASIKCETYAVTVSSHKTACANVLVAHGAYLIPLIFENKLCVKCVRR
jgi:hypothetical protein